MPLKFVAEKRNCCGCKACYDACPQHAISFETDKEGFWYPVIDQDKCVSCMKCRHVCPNINVYHNPECKEPDVYSAWMKDDDMRIESTSGGMYYPAAKKMLEMGGLVIACRYTDDWKHAEHVIVKNLDELYPTIRSKYFQSDTLGIFLKAKDILDDGRKLLFCGCPCQSAGLQSFLGKQYDNLYTMDFICRGINSQKAFEAFISEQEHLKGSNVKNVHCKNKRKGWTSLGVLMEFENGEEYYETRSNSYWSLGYIRDNLYMRPGCHECKYRTIPRVSDITIGDFWGIKDADPDDLYKGISILMINSTKGKELIETYRDELVMFPKSVNDVYKGNPCLLDSPKEGQYREKFFNLLETKKFSEAVQECCGKLGC